MNNIGKYISNIVRSPIKIKFSKCNSIEYRKCEEYESWWFNYEVFLILIFITIFFIHLRYYILFYFVYYYY